MGFKDQLIKLRDNWLIILLVVILALFMFAGMGVMNPNVIMSSKGMADYESVGYGNSLDSSRYYNGNQGTDFAPEVEERKIVKTATLASEVDSGTFADAEQRIKDIVTSSDSYLLLSSSNGYELGRHQYFRGSYTIKVDTKKYPSVLEQLKAIGDVQSLNENAQDITGSYTNVNIELAAERERLVKYNDMYDKSASVSEKLQLTDKIFDQERKVKYLEERLANMDSKIDYSEIRLTLTEDTSDYADASIAKFSSLLESLVDSFNALLHFLFVIVPWAVAAFIIYLIVRMFRKKEDKPVDKKAK